MLRPTMEDNPHFDGGNTASVSPTNPSSANNLVSTLPNDPATNQKKYQITYPFWETVGPWDVDNDNDGIRDSVWVDLGDPVLEAEDGTRYKALYAFLVVDLDSRLNVNAHGLADDIVPPLLDPTKAKNFDLTLNNTNPLGNLAHDTTNGSLVYSTLQLPRGLGYGPADISLRPVFPVPLDNSFNPMYASASWNGINRSESAGPVDSYAAVLTGRLNADGRAINGRYGYDTNLRYFDTKPGTMVKSQAATAATNYVYQTIANSEAATSPRWFTGEQAAPSLLAMLKFFDYPWSATVPLDNKFQPPPMSAGPYFFEQLWRMTEQSAFGTPPDLKGRYALGLDYSGQPVYEVTHDLNPNTVLLPLNQQLPFNLLANNPYELNLSSSQRRDDWAASYPDVASAFTSTIDRSSFDSLQHGLNDDSAFSPTDLEKILRATDPDAGTLPSRLWDVVNDFDPVKLINYDPNYVFSVTTAVFGISNPKPTDPQTLTAAQQIAAINRHLVTTDSYSLPVATQTMPGYVSEFGADGAPGRRGQTNQALNLPGTDDFQAIAGVERAKAKITDLLYYRVWLEARHHVMRVQGVTEAALDNLSAGDYTTFMGLVKQRHGRRLSAFG